MMGKPPALLHLHSITPAAPVHPTGPLTRCLLPCIFLVIAGPTCLALDNGLALAPQMGWNSWSHFYCNINETLIRDVADAMVSKGLVDAGYRFLNLDDCWQAPSRHENGTIAADPDKFPSGLKALSEYVRGRGLGFGLYSDAGRATCKGLPGSFGYETRDAAFYVEVGASYLKYDNCHTRGLPPVKERYERMRDALNATGKPIFYSMCEWGVQNPATWARDVGNSWRTTGDISATWRSIVSTIESNDRWWNYSGPGGFNDPDMIQVGNGKLTPVEQRSHFSLWCIAKAPLLLGFDVTSAKDGVFSVVSNRELIAINQDPLGVQAHRVLVDGDLEVWAGPLQNGDAVVVLFNRRPDAATIAAHWKDVGIPSNKTEMEVHDLWEHTSLGVRRGSFSAMVQAHGVVAIRLSLPNSRYPDNMAPPRLHSWYIPERLEYF